MSVDVTVETIIERPIEEVSAYAGDPANALTWYVNITSVKWRTKPPVQQGSELDFEAQFLGRRMAYTYRVTDFVPGQRLVMSTERGPFPDGDDVHLGTRRWRNPDDASQHRPAERVRATWRRGDGEGDAPRDHEGPSAAEGDPRAVTAGTPRARTPRWPGAGHPVFAQHKQNGCPAGSAYT